METRGHDRSPGPALNSEINVTPLVDVMLVVLIIFIVVAPLLHQGAAVDLPRARNLADVSAEADQTLTVTLQSGGRMLLGTEPIAPDDLAGALRMRRGASPVLRFQVRADRTAPYGEIKRILAAGRAAGFPGAALIAREVELPRAAALLPAADRRGAETGR